MGYFQFLGKQLMHRLHVVADGHDREARAVKRLGRVARRRRAAVAKQLGRDQKQLGRIEAFAGADEPLVAVVPGHVVRGQQHGIVALGIEVAVGAVAHPRLGQHGAALRFEIGERKKVVRYAVGRRLGLGAGGEASEQEKEG